MTIEGDIYNIRAIESNNQLLLQREESVGAWDTIDSKDITSEITSVTFTDVGPESISVVCTKSAGGDMKLLAPVIMQSNCTWQTPKSGYAAIPDRDSTTKSTAQSYDNTYLAYVGDSGKPTFVNVNGSAVVVSQCYSQFAGPDFCACLPVLSAYAAANN